jgi:hypothetical protein
VLVAFLRVHAEPAATNPMKMSARGREVSMAHGGASIVPTMM